MSPYFDRVVWDHIVKKHPDGTVSVAIDRIALHERTGSVALASLSSMGIPVLSPDSVFGFVDHISATDPLSASASRMPGGEAFIDAMQSECDRHGIRLWARGDDGHGIVHVACAEMGIAFPGATLVCPDSHACTLGALGAIAWGIGSSQCEEVLATNCLRMDLPRSMLVRFVGRIPSWASAKDVVLKLIAENGADCGLGYVVEFQTSDGPAFDMESRFTICNMAVELGAVTAFFRPDRATYDYLSGRRFAPREADMIGGLDESHDPGGLGRLGHDRVVECEISGIAPAISWGTNPGSSGPVDGVVPPPADWASREALDYMGLSPGDALRGLPVDGAFIGSCTNSRISDLRRAAAVIEGRAIAERVRGIVVPGSRGIKLEAEREGLDRIFRGAGFEWHEPGCGLCFFAGGHEFSPGDRIVSTTNRNFRGRQGPGVRTHICSPETVAWSAINGCISDVRDLADG